MCSRLALQQVNFNPTRNPSLNAKARGPVRCALGPQDGDRGVMSPKLSRVMKVMKVMKLSIIFWC